jgi:hypothetical protein
MKLSSPVGTVPFSDWLGLPPQPNATVAHGFAHSVSVIMAARAQQEGKKLYWDRCREEIRESA